MLLKKIQALCEHGQHFAQNEFDKQRYGEIESIVFELLEENFSLEPEKVSLLMKENNGYKTPKVDIRAVVFNTIGELLLVKERSDGMWSLPGGWADVGYTPSEVAVKETKEEAGVKVSPGRLIALQDKRCHNHPEDLYYIYKVFIECIYQGEDQGDNLETTDSGYFCKSELPPLSTPRNTVEQINMLFDFYEKKFSVPLLD